MPTTRYKILGWGERLPGSSLDVRIVNISGIAKCANRYFPLVVESELICSSLAKSILLPSPPGFLVKKGSVDYFVSLNFNLGGHDLPPIIPELFVSKNPWLSVGITMFDIWIMNRDRHEGNLHHDTDSGEVEVFDHSHTFLTNPTSNLENVVNEVDLSSHCLAPELENLDHIIDWNERIQSVPEFYIRDATEGVVGDGFTTQDAEKSADFLLGRREKLIELVRNNMNFFPKAELPPMC